MTTYKLEQTPNLFISPRFTDNNFVYYVLDKSAKSCTGYMNLKEDKLSIYGTEINDSMSMLQKLHDFLLTKSSGAMFLYANCNGACYIHVPGPKKYIGLLENVTFDWSTFGVVVPNSINDVLRKQVQQKDEELEAMGSLLSSAKDEALANKASFEALKQEAEELKKLLATSHKNKEDMDMELQRVRSEFSTKEFELETKKIEFELSKEEVKELQEQLLATKKDNQNLKKELQMIQDQLSSTCSELKSTEIMLKNYKEQLSQCTKECEDMKTRSQIMHNQLCSVEVESQSIKTELDSSIQHIKELESKLSSHKIKNQEIATELQNVRNELSNDKFELELMMSQLESSNKRTLELEEQLAHCKKESQVKDAKLLELQEQLSLIMNDQLQSMKIMMELNRKEMEDKSFDECFVTKAIEIVDA